MVHDFMVTRNHVMFPILPLTGDFERAKRGMPAYAWEPGKGAFIGVMKRNATVDTVRWFEIEPNYVFHPMNAWEDGEQLHCELMQYPTAPLFPNADGSPGKQTEARLTRWTIDLASTSNQARREQIDDLSGEFPRFDERRAAYSDTAAARYSVPWLSLVMRNDARLVDRTLRQMEGEVPARVFQLGDRSLVTQEEADARYQAAQDWLDRQTRKSAAR